MLACRPSTSDLRPAADAASINPSIRCLALGGDHRTHLDSVLEAVADPRAAAASSIASRERLARLTHGDRHRRGQAALTGASEAESA